MSAGRTAGRAVAGAKVVISPRATIDGCRLLETGMSAEEALNATIRAKLPLGAWDAGPG